MKKWLLIIVTYFTQVKAPFPVPTKPIADMPRPIWTFLNGLQVVDCPGEYIYTKTPVPRVWESFQHMNTLKTDRTTYVVKMIGQIKAKSTNVQQIDYEVYYFQVLQDAPMELGVVTLFSTSLALPIKEIWSQLQNYLEAIGNGTGQPVIRPLEARDSIITTNLFKQYFEKQLQRDTDIEVDELYKVKLTSGGNEKWIALAFSYKIDQESEFSMAIIKESNFNNIEIIPYRCVTWREVFEFPLPTWNTKMSAKHISSITRSFKMKYISTDLKFERFPVANLEQLFKPKSSVDLVTFEISQAMHSQTSKIVSFCIATMHDNKERATLEGCYSSYSDAYQHVHSLASVTMIWINWYRPHAVHDYLIKCVAENKVEILDKLSQLLEDGINKSTNILQSIGETKFVLSADKVIPMCYCFLGHNGISNRELYVIVHRIILTDFLSLFIAVVVSSNAGDNYNNLKVEKTGYVSWSYYTLTRTEKPSFMERTWIETYNLVDWSIEPDESSMVHLYLAKWNAPYDSNFLSKSLILEQLKIVYEQTINSSNILKACTGKGKHSGIEFIVFQISTEYESAKTLRNEFVLINIMPRPEDKLEVKMNINLFKTPEEAKDEAGKIVLGLSAGNKQELALTSK